MVLKKEIDAAKKWMFKLCIGMVAALLLVTTLPIQAKAAPGDGGFQDAGSYVRLKNKWKSNYLYEASDGTVRYGVTAIGDSSAQWRIESANGHQRLKNRATGHYITVSAVAKRGDALTAAAVAQSTLDDQWIIEEASRPGYRIIKNAKDPAANLVIHEEDQLGFAEASGDINVTFESPQWMLEPVQEGEPVRIVNQYKAGQALFEDADGFVQFGEADPTDAASHWYVQAVVQNGDGAATVRLLNRATGHVITQGVDWDKIQALPPDNTVKSEWIMAAATDPQFVTFTNVDGLTADPANPLTYVLNTQFPDDKYARSNNWAQPDWGSAQWKIEKAYDVKPVRIVNFTKEAVGTAYLYEDDQIVKYGPLEQADSGNPAYLWTVEDDDGMKRIRNVSTGHYMSTANVRAGTDPLQALPLAASEATDQWAIAASAIYDDYKTIRSGAGSDVYLNIADAAGSAQAGATNPDTDPAQWLLEDPTAPLDGSPQIVRIQNEWQSLYLYEDSDGNLKYGNAAPGDQHAQWIIERFNGRKRIKNRATGHYINLENMTDGRIRVTEVGDDWTSAVWVIEDLGGGTRLIHSVQDRNDDPNQQKFIHLQNLTKYAEYGVINRNWGSPHWKFTPVVEEMPRNVRLKNKLTGQYLYEETAVGDDAGKVKYGDVADDDKTSVWFLEDTGDGVGSVRLKNIATGHYLVMENVGEDVSQDAPPEQLMSVGDICTCWGSAKWYPDPGTADGLVVFRSGWAGHYIYADGEGYVKVSKLVAAEDSAQFAAEPYQAPAQALPEQPVRIRNIFNNQYLYENAGGIVMYGDPAENNGYSHWIIESPDGAARLKNRATGHYLALNGDYRFVEAKPSEDGDSAVFQWSVENAPDGVNYLVRSLDGPYSDEYLNVQNAAGYAEHGLYPFTFGSLQWAFEPATETFQTPPNTVVKNTHTATPALDDTNAVRISVASTGGPGSAYLYESDGAIQVGFAREHDRSAQWLLQDFNGRKLLKNQATGHLLALNGQGMVLANGTDTDETTQWLIGDKLGFKTIRNAGRPSGSLARGAGGAQYRETGAHPDALWRFEPVVSDVKYEAEDAFLGGGVHVSTAVEGYSGQGYADGFSSGGAQVSFAVNAQAEGTYRAVVRYFKADRGANLFGLYVNGLPVKHIVLKSSKGADWEDAAFDVRLRSGINSIDLQLDKGNADQVAIDYLIVKDSVNKDSRGATVPYVSYEAEDAVSSGTLIGPSRTYRDMASEASGRQAVRLDQTGQYVEFQLAQPANSIVLRYAMPDSADGQGLNETLALYVDGKFKRNLELTSKYAWEYGSYPWSNDPKQGSGHRFYDEAHALIGDVPAGATVRLQKDAANSASYYVIDLVDMEQVADPLRQPKGFVSVEKFGAVPDDGKNDTDAFKEAMATAQRQHKGVWFPQGQFELDGELLYLDDIAIRGAGMWYTTLRGAKFIGKGKNIQVADLLIDGGINVRDDEAHTNAFEGGFGPGSAIRNVWIEHTKAGLWLTELSDSPEYTDGLHMLGLRIRNLMADAINFCVGTSNSMMEQSDIRYPGDDGIALWSYTKPSVNNTVRFNNVALPWLADNIVVFGGKDNKIQDNVAKDTITNGAGIAVSTRFNPVPFSGTTLVERNTLIRTGSHDSGYGIDLGAFWIFASDKDLDGTVIIRDNVALDSTYEGLVVHGTFNVRDVLLQNLVLDGMGTNGVETTSGVKGEVQADNVIIRDERMTPVSDTSEDFNFTETGKGFSSLVRP